MHLKLTLLIWTTRFTPFLRIWNAKFCAFRENWHLTIFGQRQAFHHLNYLEKIGTNPHTSNISNYQSQCNYSDRLQIPNYHIKLTLIPIVFNSSFKFNYSWLKLIIFGGFKLTVSSFRLNFSNTFSSHSHCFLEFSSSSSCFIKLVFNTTICSFCVFLSIM